MESFCFFGTKTHSMFDIWSIEHFISGISIGSFAIYFSNKKFKNIEKKLLKYFEITFILFISYLWETIEHYLETGLAGEGVAFWLQGVEHWSNRIISDPLLVLLGYIVVSKYKFLSFHARIFSTLWLYLHIFVFPHSMYLQDLL